MKRRVRLILLSVLAILALWFLWRVRRLVTPLVLAAALSYILMPVVTALERRAVPRSLAIIVVYVFVGLLAASILSFLVPFLVTEVETLIDTLPEQTARLEGLTLDRLHRLRSQASLPATMREGIQSIVVGVERALATMTTRVVGAVLAVFTSVFYMILAPVLAYFIMRDWASITDGFLGFFPTKYHTRLVALGSKVNRVLAGFIRGQLIVSFIIGLIIAGGLAILGVRYALVVGLIAGAFEVVPYFGPIIGAVPAVFLALLDSPVKAVYAAVLFVVVNQLESAILSPKVMGDSVGLHPLTVIFAILAGAEVAGIIGMLVAVPLTAVVKVVGEFVVHWMVEEQGA